MNKMEQVKFENALFVIREKEREGWRLIGDEVTGWRFVKPAPKPKPFFFGGAMVERLVKAGLLEETATGCYQTIDND